MDFSAKMWYDDTGDENEKHDVKGAEPAHVTVFKTADDLVCGSR